MKDKPPVSIRGLDIKLYREARADAVRRGINIGDWLNQAIKEKLLKK